MRSQETIPAASWEHIVAVLSFNAGYNTTLVVIGASLLGFGAGVVGCFGVLRRRSLIGDALAHSALPGLAAAYLLGLSWGISTKSLPWLLTGATFAGVLGVLSVHFLASATRLKEDTAIASVLSVFFGVGVVLLSVVQSMPSSEAAGLYGFIYGQTAAMRLSDSLLLGGSAGAVIALTLLFAKEFALLCFDADFAKVLGWPVKTLDILLLLLLTAVTVVGLQTVGILLVVALLIIPATAARFWSDRLRVILLLSAAFGAMSGYLGAAISALFPRMPAGSVIVLTAGTIFVVSMVFAPRRGVLWGGLHVLRLRFRILREHCLRELYEFNEARQVTLESSVPYTWLSRAMGGSRISFLLTLATLVLQSRLRLQRQGASLTPLGIHVASEFVRRHRLWEEYLVSAGELNPQHVDYSADLVEHVLNANLVRELEKRLIATGRLPKSTGDTLPSVHEIKGPEL